LLLKVREYYKKNKEDLYAKISKLKEKTYKKPSEGELSKSIISDTIGIITDHFDPVYGGFGTAPKFPFPEALELVLSEYFRKKDESLFGILRITLDTMAESGTFDQEMGGFFRYSTTRDWSIPHFEKMCEDNAKLLSIYLKAYQLTQRSKYKETAEKIIKYVDTTLRDKEFGVFFGSQDADEEYYKLNSKEREKRKAPYVDKTIYTDWNARMASSYLLAYYVLEEPKYHKFALKTIEFLLLNSYSKENGMYHYFFDGKPKVLGLLTDQINMAQGLIDAYSATGEPKYLNFAVNLADFILENLWNAEFGALSDKIEDPKAIGALRYPDISLAENSIAADLLIRLHYLTNKKDYKEMAYAILSRFSKDYQGYNLQACGYALAVDRYLNPPVKMNIVGSIQDLKTLELLAECNKVYEPRKIIQVLDTIHDKEKLSQIGYAPSEIPVVYICIDNICLAPISKPEDIKYK
ncbi:MAG: thioredoxin domain-containing protein, partial [Methanosarcinales archaeon]